MCAWDEDVVTMAVEAGRDCLGRSPSAAVSRLTLASTSAPYADANNAMLVSSALRLPTECAAMDASGSTRVGLTALIAACRAHEPQSQQIVIASERRRAKPGSVQEMTYGCGAAAIAVGRGGDLIAEMLGAETLTVPFVDHFRPAGAQHDYTWEERWIRDEGVAKMVPAAVTRLLVRLGRSAESIAHFAVAGGPLRSDAQVAKILGISADVLVPNLNALVGDTGAAHSLLMLASALERAKPGDLIVVASFAQGCEVVAFEMIKELQPQGRRGVGGSLKDRLEESAYMKLLANDGHVQLDWGMRAETDQKTALTQLYRSADQIFGFVGAQCGACGCVQFPRMPACVSCGVVGVHKAYPLSDEAAHIATFTADWLQYCPSPPMYLGLVQFEPGARVLMEITDVGPAGLEVGMPVSMRFRIKERDPLRGWDRYFWKAVPATK